MMRRVKTTIRSNKHIISKSNFPRIHKIASVIGKEIIPHLYIEAKATEYIGFHIGIPSNSTKQLPDQCFSALFVIGRRPVIFLTQQQCLCDQFLTPPKRCIIHLSTDTFFKFSLIIVNIFSHTNSISQNQQDR